MRCSFYRCFFNWSLFFTASATCVYRHWTQPTCFTRSGVIEPVSHEEPSPLCLDALILFAHQFMPPRESFIGAKYLYFIWFPLLSLMLRSRLLTETMAPSLLPSVFTFANQLSACFPPHPNKWHVNPAGTGGCKWAPLRISKWHFNKDVCGDTMGRNETPWPDVLTAWPSPSYKPTWPHGMSKWKEMMRLMTCIS